MASPAGAAGRVAKSRGGGEWGGRRSATGRGAPTSRARFRGPASPATRINSWTEVSLRAEATLRSRARVAAYVCACGAEGARPVAMRVRDPAAAWDGPACHSQVQTRLVKTAALARPRIQAVVTVRPGAIRRARVHAGASV